MEKMKMIFLGENKKMISVIITKLENCLLWGTLKDLNLKASKSKKN